MADPETVQVHVGFVIERAHVASLFDALHARGYATVGPTVREGAVVYDDLAAVDDLPIGWGDHQEGGVYRLTQRADGALFGFTLGPNAWKRFLFPPVVRLWQAQRDGNGFIICEDERAAPKYALIGVRACELHAIQLQDRIYLEGPYVDADYKQRRENAFIVAVNCGQAGGTCFCVSMKSGPGVGPGFDLALTEILTPDRHFFVVDVGSDLGAAVLADLPHRLATESERAQAAAVVAETAAHMGRMIETDGLKEMLYRNLEHPHWDEVAERCLTCGNCTLVCPTCFCHTVEDVTTITGQTADHWRKVDSCFTTSFSFISSGSIRSSAKARYRQWLTHKLASWVDQFGTYGCVGCGRCITWCPVGIDLTEEAAAIGQPSHHAGGAR